MELISAAYCKYKRSWIFSSATEKKCNNQCTPWIWIIYLLEKNWFVHIQTQQKLDKLNSVTVVHYGPYWQKVRKIKGKYL